MKYWQIGSKNNLQSKNLQLKLLMGVHYDSHSNPPPLSCHLHRSYGIQAASPWYSPVFVSGQWFRLQGSYCPQHTLMELQGYHTLRLSCADREVSLWSSLETLSSPLGHISLETDVSLCSETSSFKPFFLFFSPPSCSSSSLDWNFQAKYRLSITK